ncbi:major histocompatibility complex class I-related gene protein-like isoform X2 [Ranitomeya imitator]|uniref:major histocompatibility complex class I-related gene protein-like isoform X2 n=1 Tax=Ranitomeya imitator TaxID=111125 RepID=UPI0037E8AF67
MKLFFCDIKCEKEKMFVLTVIFLSVTGVYTDTHTLRYCYTGVSEPGSGLPEFTGIAYVDDQQIMLFSSDTGRTIPVAQWMKENEGPEVWEHETRIGKEHEALFKSELQLWKKIFNYTEGFHFLKISVSCELRDDGSTKGCWQMRYDEKEYIYLDILNTLFIPTMADAHLVTERWNSPDVKMGEITKIYLETECIPKLKRFAEHGREVLERRVRPQVKVSGQEKGDAMKLHCQVYGFYPRPVDVKWMNGKDEVHSYETTRVLPNPDGTYQIRVSTEVTPKDGDSYSCYVDHSSLEEPLLVQWEPKQSMVLVVIVGVGLIIIVVLASAGIFIYKNFRREGESRSGQQYVMCSAAPLQDEEERRLRNSVTQEA